LETDYIFFVIYNKERKMSNPSSIAAWNEYLKSFVNELCETFPECPDLFALLGVIDAMIDDDEHSVLEKFIAEIEPHTEALTNMDEGFFLNSDIDFLKKLGVKQYWTPDLEQETKQAIWQYLQTLLVMGKTIQSVPPHMLRMLEDYASKITSQMEDGQIDQSQLNIQSLGFGALCHMQQCGPPPAAGQTNAAATASGAGMFGPLFENMTQTDMANIFTAAQNFPLQVNTPQIPAPVAPVAPVAPAAHAGNRVPVTPTSGGGGFDRLFGQFANSGGSIWGASVPPLYGHHPMFTGAPGPKQ
jgi:hypothetical protein